MQSRYFSPDFTKWQKIDALMMWELAVLMYGVDPDVFSDCTVQGEGPRNGVGESPDLSVFRRQLESGVISGTLPTCGGGLTQPWGKTYIPRVEAARWLKDKGYDALAEGLNPAEPKAVQAERQNTPIATAVSRSTAQRNIILTTIRDLGYDPKRLPPNPRGKRGVKAQVRVLVNRLPAFSATTAFDRAWQHALDDGDIVISSEK